MCCVTVLLSETLWPRLWSFGSLCVGCCGFRVCFARVSDADCSLPVTGAPPPFLLLFLSHISVVTHTQAPASPGSSQVERTLSQRLLVHSGWAVQCSLRTLSPFNPLCLLLHAGGQTVRWSWVAQPNTRSHFYLLYVLFSFTLNTLFHIELWWWILSVFFR